jgi:hypothetical protein
MSKGLPPKPPTAKDLFGGKPQIAPGVNPGVTVDQLKPLTCQCGETLFLHGSNVYYASPLQSATATPTLVQVPLGFICTGCGELNKFDTSELPMMAPVPDTKQ